MRKAYSPVPVPDYDARWKEVIYVLPEQFLKYFFKPSFYEKIDFAKGIHPMDKELQKSFPDWGKDGRLYPDKMLKMFLKKTTCCRLFWYMWKWKPGTPRSLPSGCSTTFSACGTNTLGPDYLHRYLYRGEAYL